MIIRENFHTDEMAKLLSDHSNIGFLRPIMRRGANPLDKVNKGKLNFFEVVDYQVRNNQSWQLSAVTDEYEVEEAKQLIRDLESLDNIVAELYKAYKSQMSFMEAREVRKTRRLIQQRIEMAKRAISQGAERGIYGDIFVEPSIEPTED